MADGHDPKPTPNRGRPRRRRRWRWMLAAAGVAALGLIALAASAPTLLSTDAARARVVAAANERLAPGRIELGGLDLSWTRPITLSGLALYDPAGKRVVAAASARTDRGLLDLLRGRPDFGTVTVSGAEVDVERRADGSVDLLDALAGLLGPGDDAPPPPGPVDLADPGPAVKVVVSGGRLRVASPELEAPLEAESFEAALTLEPGKPLDLAADLAGGGDRSLSARARYDHHAAGPAPADLSVEVSGRDWPVAVRHAGVSARGRFDGTLGAGQAGGAWSARGEATLRDLAAEGPALGGDRLELERVEAACELAEGPAGWTVARLSINSPVASLSASGPLPAGAGTPTKVEGRVDLAALARMLPRAMRLREGLEVERGTLNLRADLVDREGSERIALTLGVDDLRAVEGGRPVELRAPATASAVLLRSGESVEVQSLAVQAAGVDAKASGDLDRGVKLSGRVDLAAVREQLADLVDLGEVELAGQASVVADYRREGDAFRAGLAADFEGLRVAGLSAEPIARDRARVRTAAEGPARPDGLPAGWRSARLILDAGDASADLAVTDAGAGAIGLSGTASATVAEPVAARLDLKTSLRWDGRAADFAELRLAATPADPALAHGRVALATSGRYDPDTDTLALVPLPGEPAGAVNLVEPGMFIRGLAEGGSAPLAVDASLAGDLAGADRLAGAWSGSEPNGVGGAFRGRALVVRAPQGRIDIDGRVAVADLAAPTPQGPVELALRAGYEPVPDRLDLAALDLSTALGRLVAAGSVASATGDRLADLHGTLDPRWEALDPMIAGSLGPDARVRAAVRPFRLRGPLAGGTTQQVLRGLEGELGLDLTEGRASGLVVGPTPIVLKLGGGRAVFDPIQTTVNGAPAVIGADLYLDDPETLWLRLARGSRVENLPVDELSGQWLAYVAPVLSQATAVQGAVSLTVDRAAIPLTGTGSMRVDARLAFRDVAFQPGPLAAEVVSLTGRPAPRLAINQELNVHVANGRVGQSGLSIPVDGDARLAFEGSVGFDQTLALRASVPLTARMLGRDDLVNQIAAGTQVALPIGGTLTRPSIDRAGFQVALRDAARSMMRRGVQAGAGQLLDRLAPPGPNPGQGGRGGSPGRDALRALENIGREALDPSRPPR